MIVKLLNIGINKQKAIIKIYITLGSVCVFLYKAINLIVGLLIFK